MTNGLARRSAPVDAIEHVEETVAVRVQQKLAGLPVPVRIDEHGRLLRIPVPEVVRRELEVPLEPSSRGLQREDRVGVEIVALPLAAVVVGTRIARRPVERVELRIVRARQPRGAAAMFDVGARPCFRAGLARLRHRPEPPRFLSRFGVERGNEPADALVAARRSDDHQLAHDQRRRRGAVVLARIRHARFPHQFAREPVQREQLRIVGDDEEAAARDRRAAIDAGRRVAGEPFRSRTLEVPDAPARAGIERVAFVHGGDIHDAVDDDRRDLEPGGVGKREDPGGRKTRDRGAVDLIDRRVAVAVRRAVIRRPVHLRRHATMARTVLAKQLQRAIVGEHLHVVRRAIEQEPRERRAVGGVDADACRRLAAARPERANEGDQLAKFGVGELKPRHAFRGEARRERAWPAPGRSATVSAS